MSQRIIVPRALTHAPSIRPVILGSIRNATPSDGMGAALLLAAVLFGAGVVFGWAFSHVDAPACISSDHQPGRGM